MSHNPGNCAMVVMSSHSTASYTTFSADEESQKAMRMNLSGPPLLRERASSHEMDDRSADEREAENLKIEGQHAQQVQRDLGLLLEAAAAGRAGEEQMKEEWKRLMKDERKSWM